MPEATLVLYSGMDQALVRGIRVLAVLGLLSLATVGATVSAQLIGACVLLAFWLRFETWRERHGLRIVSLDRHGRIRDAGQEWQFSAGWLSSRYCVLTCRRAGKKRRLLISSSRHDPGEYRKILSWIGLDRLSESESST